MSFYSRLATSLKTLALSSPLLISACASSSELSSSTSFSPALQSDLAKMEVSAQRDLNAQPPADGHLTEYLDLALRRSPGIRAAYNAWRAKAYRAKSAGRWKEPSLSAGYFLRSVETRTGPQVYRVDISQAFPWPGSSSSAKKAANASANAQAREVANAVLALRRDLSRVYWQLWNIDEEQRLRKEHDTILNALAEAVRARLTTGSARLSELTQLELKVARHHDHVERHAQARVAAEAELLALAGLTRPSGKVVISDVPKTGRPKLGKDELLAKALEHPTILRWRDLAKSARQRQHQETANRYPTFKLGASLIGIGDSAAATPDSGNDALVVMGGLSLPFWQGSYASAMESERAQEQSHLDRERSARLAVGAELEQTWAQLIDVERRMTLVATTFMPQAQASFDAVVGDYQAGASSVASLLLAQQELIELSIELVDLRATHASLYAQLEYLVGEPLVPSEAAEGPRGEKQ